MIDLKGAMIAAGVVVFAAWALFPRAADASYATAWADFAPELNPPAQSLTPTEGRLFMTPTVNLVGLETADADAARELIRFLKERGVAVNEKKDAASVTIRVGPVRKDLPPQGYALAVRNDAARPAEISIAGADAEGTYYGVQTLKQLIPYGNAAISTLEMTDYPAFKRRGVVEGFYGAPWTHRDRLNQFKFFGEHKLNIYIYAPKDDPYHREKWREPYPASQMARMQELIAAAKSNKVEFVFAVSPGIDIAFDGEAGERDYAALIKKFNALYEMGVRSFAVYFDDIEDKSGEKQAKLLNRVKREFIDQKEGARPLITVPTEYYTQDMADAAGGIKPYTQAFSSALAPGIEVMYTGPAVVAEGIDRENIRLAARIYKRNMAIWWNYPVTDYMKDKLALGPIYGLSRELADDSSYFLMNPMEHASLSRISLHTGAQYGWNPKQYRPERALKRALETLFGDLAEDMAVFAAHNSRMDNDWAHTGMADAPIMRKTMDLLWEKLERKEDAADEAAKLDQMFDRMERAHARLSAELPPEFAEECEEQLALFGKLAGYDRIALRMVEAKLRRDEMAYQSLRLQTLRNQKHVDGSRAKTSERTAAAFLTEALEFTKKQ